MDQLTSYGRLRGLMIIGAVLICGLSVFTYKFKLAIVSGESMLPTLKSGDVLVVDRRAYETGQPRRGDVVVARYGKSLIVKRIAGLPGEEVEVKSGMLFINNVLVVESHSVEHGLLDIAKGKLLEGDYASLGDNRAVPPDLAVHPILSQGEIRGKVVFSCSLVPTWTKGVSFQVFANR